MSSNLVKSPEKAMWCLEEPVFDAAMGGSKVAITVHQRGNQSVINTWLYTSEDGWRRILVEKVLNFSPNIAMLQGEINRLLEACFLPIQIGLGGPVNSITRERLVLVINGLQQQASELIREKKHLLER